MKIIHHNDADGYMSAKIVSIAQGLNDNDFICMDYTKGLDLSLIDKNELVYIVDYSLEPGKMKSLLEITKNVAWIDHHKSAIDKYKDFPELNEINGFRFDGISATGLAWLYINGNAIDTGNYAKDYYYMMTKLEKAPLSVQLINDWDVWNHFKYDTKPFMVALNSEIDCWTSPNTLFWYDLYKNDSIVKELVEKGKIMTKFRDGWASKFRFNYGFTINLEGHKVFCLNLGNANSEYFGDLIDKFDAVMTFCYKGTLNLFNASIYSNGKVDVSEIAKKFGGGGHKGASGFTFDSFDFITSRLEK